MQSYNHTWKASCQKSEGTKLPDEWTKIVQLPSQVLERHQQIIKTRFQGTHIGNLIPYVFYQALKTFHL